jgi:hypothetical protein
MIMRSNKTNGPSTKREASTRDLGKSFRHKGSYFVKRASNTQKYKGNDERRGAYHSAFSSQGVIESRYSFYSSKLAIVVL